MGKRSDVERSENLPSSWSRCTSLHSRYVAMPQRLYLFKIPALHSYPWSFCSKNRSVSKFGEIKLQAFWPTDFPRLVITCSTFGWISSRRSRSPPQGGLPVIAIGGVCFVVYFTGIPSNYMSHLPENIKLFKALYPHSLTCVIFQRRCPWAVMVRVCRRTWRLKTNIRDFIETFDLTHLTNNIILFSIRDGFTVSYKTRVKMNIRGFHFD